ncbi:MAG: hypothetical protein EPO39_20230 [Candidatus Manganitrophaceae bacterium]|nr:MAG: hypothetical protein EPO39_20230 [Candidatus Manganitrophaceae bacterium]
MDAQTMGKDKGQRGRMNWSLIGPGLLLVAALFIVASYLYDQKFHRTVLEHHPEAPDIPGGNLSNAILTASDEGKDFLRLWQTKTRRLKGAQYDMEIVLNDIEFFKALSKFEGRGEQEEEKLYKAYLRKYEFDEKPVFTVTMHSATGRLFDLKPNDWMTLHVKEGEHPPYHWAESKRSIDYHREAVLTFEGRHGHPIVSPELKEVELIVKDPAGKSEEVLQWGFGQ